jgi:glycosyltransferase involved in cell wall biosynthesis
MRTAMKVLVNALGAEMGGALRHLTNFLPALGDVRPDWSYVVLLRGDLPELQVPSNVHLDIRPRPRFGWGLLRLVHDVVVLPIRSYRAGFDVVVSLTNMGPIWSPIPHVLFQRNALLYYPEYLSGLRGFAKLEMTLRRLMAVGSADRAALVVTPSSAMAHMMQDCYPHLSARHFRTLHHGFDRTSYTESLAGTLAAKVAEVPRPRLLYPSHVAPYKGIDILFSALGRLKRQGSDIGLVIAGHPSDSPPMAGRLEDMLRTGGLGDTVRFLGGVSQSQMGALFTACDAVVNPSLCESFGFSMVEAMGYGMPIVAADLAVNRELCGEAACYYPARDPEKAAQAILEAVHEPTSSSLRAAAARKFAEFDWSWSRYAREFCDLVEMAAGSAMKTGGR